MASNVASPVELTAWQRHARARPTRRGNASAWVYDTVRAGFREGYYDRDHTFSEFELMSFFNVTRASVREALARLTHEGLLTRSPKRGTVPAADTVHVTVTDDVGFHVHGAEIAAAFEETIVSSATINASVFLAAQLLMEQGDPVRVDESFVTVSGQPFATIMLYSQVGTLTARGVEGAGAYPERIERMGFPIATIDSSFESTSADSVTSLKLRIPEAAPLLQRTLSITGIDGSRLLSVIRMRADRAVVHTSRTFRATSDPGGFDPLHL
jgi:DNA-binding GntR family transcriptional regulator